MSEHGLEAGQDARGTVVRSGVTTPEAELPSVRGDDPIGGEAQQHQAARHLIRVVDLVVTPGQPGLELPAHARDQRGRGEPSLVTPAADEALAVLGLGLHDDPIAREPEGPQALEQVVGEGLRDECRFVDTRTRVDPARPSRPDREEAAPAVLSSRSHRSRAGARGTVDTEARQHRRTGQRGEVAQGPQTETSEEIRECDAVLTARSTTSTRTPTGHGARNRRVAPGGTTCTATGDATAWRVEPRTHHQQLRRERRELPRRATTASTCAASASSPPK